MHDTGIVVYLVKGPVRRYGILSRARPGGKGEIGTMAGFEIRFFGALWDRIVKKGIASRGQFARKM